MISNLLLLVSFTSFVFGGRVVIFPESFVPCNENHPIKSLDFSKLKVVVESDYDVFINGTTKHLKSFKSPIKGRISGEQLVRGKWVITGFDRKISDLCATMHNPMEAWYYVFKDFEKCPVPAGVNQIDKIIKNLIIKLFSDGLEIQHDTLQLPSHDSKKLHRKMANKYKLGV
jgi:hypothetical protein